MNGTVLKTAMMVGMDAAIAANPEAGPAQRDAIFQAMCDAIVTHIQTTAVVTVAVASVSGVTVGPGVSGPGAGTGSIS